MKSSKRPGDAFTGPQSRGLLTLLVGGRTRSNASPEEREMAFKRVMRIVKKNYSVISGDHDATGIFIKIIMDPDTNEKKFEGIRISLRDVGLFPKLIDTGSETILAIFPLPLRKGSNYWINFVLLILTMFTTVWAGATLWEERTGEMVELSDMIKVLADPVDLGMGALTFALPLLLILGVHELGHYFTSRRYHVEASLPYFIPVPPLLSPFGTFGALISMKEPISNRKALVDIGAAGPIAGFIVAIPITLIGLILTGAFPSTQEMIEGVTYAKINPPLLFRAMMAPLGLSPDVDYYPTAIAGWIGLFVTSINLFPSGQLDGGHIARGVLGEKGKILSFVTVAVLIVLGFTTPFKTYLLFAFFILFMGTRHPPPLDDISKISKRQYWTAGLSLLIMALTFHPVPIEIVESQLEGVLISDAPLEINVSAEVPLIFSVTIENKGRLEKEVELLVMIDNRTVVYDAFHPEPDWNSSTFGPLIQLSDDLLVHDGWYILIVDPLKMKIEGGKGKEQVRMIIVGCSPEKERSEEAVLDLGFRTEKEVVWVPILMCCNNTSSI